MIAVDNVLFYFAGMPVYVYGFFTSIGLLFGATSALKAGRRRGIGWSNMFDFILGTAFVFLPQADLQSYGDSMEQELY